MEMTPREQYVSPRSTWVTKLLLRGLSVLFCIIIAGVGGTLVSAPRVSPFIMAYIAPAIVVCFVWSIAEGICIWVRGGHRGIHPGAIVAVDLIIWLGLTFICAILGFASIITYGWGSDYGYTTTRYDSRTGRYVYEYTGSGLSDRNRLLGLGRALFAFFILLTLAHFALFVIGCVETNIRNRQPKTVYVMQPVYANGQPMVGQFQMAPGTQYSGTQYPGPQYPGTQYPIQAPPAVHSQAPVKTTESSPERFA